MNLKYVGFLGRVFLVNVAAGVGAMTGIVGTGVVMTKVFRPSLKKAWDAIPVPNVETEESK